jgi:small subunit ribosomal protein S9
MVKSTISEFIATGRRKTSVARVRLIHGVGKRQINGQTTEQYFGTEALRSFIEQPLVAVDSEKQYDIIAKVHGGGKVGQAGALRHGIARALVAADEHRKQALKDGGFLTRDSRMKERKKPGQPGARKRFQFSKR